MFIKVLFHGIPLVGIILGRPILTVALLLLVVLPYIKVKKMSVQLEDTKLNHQPEAKEAIDKLETAKNFWKKLTFMK